MGQEIQFTFRAKDWCNADIKLMALEMVAQANDIRDEDTNATLRRSHLCRASSKLLEAYAELEELTDLGPVH